jgi:hypothetical protein
MEPVQDLNLNRRYILGLEPELPVTHVGGYAVYMLSICSLYALYNTMYSRICICTCS